jgi:hypothetical protein
MSRAFPLRLPESIRRTAEGLAREDRVNLNQFIATAVAEKVSALNAATCFRTRAARFRPRQIRSDPRPPRQPSSHEGDEAEGK